jgi:hypothetical protein
MASTSFRTVVTALCVLSTTGCKQRTSAHSDTQARPKTQAGSSKDTKGSAPNATDRGFLWIGDLGFAGAVGHRDDASFGRGERALLLVSVERFASRGEDVDLSADVELFGQAGTVFRKRGITLLRGPARRGKQRKPGTKPGHVRAGLRIQLHPATPKGRYTVKLTVRDNIGGGRASAKTALQVVGRPLPRSTALAIQSLRLSGDPKAPAGSVLPFSLVATGLKSASRKGRHHMSMRLTTSLLDKTAKVLATRTRKIEKSLPFACSSFPIASSIAIPADARAGRYRLQVELESNGTKIGTKIPFEVVADRFSVFHLHLHDTGGLPRDTFRFGETMRVRFSVRGFATKKGTTEKPERARLEVDLAVGGPGGVYFARKKAAQLAGQQSVTWAAVKRFPRQIAVRLPRLAPPGRYKVVVRARDLLAQKETLREREFQLAGKAPKPVGTFRIDKLDARFRPDLPKLKGDSFIGGKRYHLTARVAPGKLTPIKKGVYEIEVEGNIKLRSLRGVEIQSYKGLFRYKRRLTYIPLRLFLSASWTPPSDLPKGLYDLEVNLLEPKRNRVSTLRRRVELIPKKSP